jgi:peptidoglycan hydrolase-like protein with peptidoglycan-binding domain
VATSQNGWPASSDKGSLGINSGFAPCGVAYPGGVKSGDVETVLRYLAEQYHARVEPLVSGWCWGYTYKEISGSNTISNHGSGTALDFNAPDHPYGVRGTFNSGQVSQIRAILAEVSPAVRWGGDYSGSGVDEMHFEINASAATVADVAARLGGGGSVPPSAGGAPGYPLASGYYFGPKDGPNESISCQVPGVDTHYQDDFRLWQQRMIDRGWQACFTQYGADGMYGDTIDVSEAGQCALQFQAEKGLTVDGLIGPETWAAAWTYPIT